MYFQATRTEPNIKHRLYLLDQMFALLSLFFISTGLVLAGTYIFYLLNNLHTLLSVSQLSIENRQDSELKLNIINVLFQQSFAAAQK